MTVACWVLPKPFWSKILTTKNRTRKITVRFSRDEYSKYLSLFENTKNDYSQSEFIRDCIFHTVPPQLMVKKSSSLKPTLCDKERVRQIAGLTNNINQIAKNLNILMKSSSQAKFLSYLHKLDTISTYCEDAFYEVNK